MSQPLRDPVKPTSFEVLGVTHLGRPIDFPLEELAKPISDKFPWFRVEITNAQTDPAEAYDRRRKQYHSTRILVLLEKEIEALGVDSLLGVTSFDLFVPGFNFVFGEARLPGHIALISTHRLSQTPADSTDLFRQRVIKEAVHETGHMVGLKHCSNVLCVMHFSESLFDTDRKAADLCKDCQSKLRLFEVA